MVQLRAGARKEEAIREGRGEGRGLPGSRLEDTFGPFEMWLSAKKGMYLQLIGVSQKHLAS